MGVKDDQIGGVLFPNLVEGSHQPDFWDSWRLTEAAELILQESPERMQSHLEPFQKCRSNCEANTKQFFEMPLCVYVLLSFVVSGYVFVSAQCDLMKGCESNSLMLSMGFVAMNVVFSIMYKLWV